MNKIKFNRSNVLILSISIFLLTLLVTMIYLLFYIFQDKDIPFSENSSEAAYFINNFED